jgi:hypothetical protein
MSTDGHAVSSHDMLAELYRLVEALDRRAPQVERLGEARIARDAADLRARTISLIRRLEAVAPCD